MDSLLFLRTPAGVDEYVDPSAALPPQPVGADRTRPNACATERLNEW